MTFAIIAVVVLVVIVLFVLMSKKPAEGESQAPKQKLESARPGPKSARPAAKAGEPGAREEEAAPARSVRPEPSATPPKSAPPSPPRDLSGLRKGLAKARGGEGFLGRLASLFAGKKELDPAIADQVEEILLTSDVGVATTQAILGRLRDGLGKNELASSQAVWDALRADAKRILGIGGGKVAISHKPEVI